MPLARFCYQDFSKTLKVKTKRLSLPPPKKTARGSIDVFGLLKDAKLSAA